MLEILSGLGNTENAKLVSNFTLSGAFDIEIYFNVDVFTDGLAPPSQFGLGIGFGAPSAGISIDNYIAREVVAGSDTFRAAYTRVTPVGGGGSSVGTPPAGSIANGALRIRRTSSTYTFWYLDLTAQAPHWQWNASPLGYSSVNGPSTDDARVILFADNQGGQITAQMTNFKVREGLVKWLN